MAVKKIDIENFLESSRSTVVIDVRSPSEYLQAHIPGAINIYLFSDEERKTVGTLYKQQSREDAIKSGLDFFGPRMRMIVEEVEKIATGKNLLLHCWRGGMRSAAVAWLLDLYGYNVTTLAGGYKAYRNWVLAQFEKQYEARIVGGFTGSGKTLLLDALKAKGCNTIDLEDLAKHKGSALGALENIPQPRQEMFENLLAHALKDAASKNEPIYFEDESQRIGNLQIPMALWQVLRSSPVYFFDIPFDKRLDYLTEEYSKLPKEKLVNAILRIQKRLGGLDTKNAIGFLVENNFKDAFAILLKYYDKYYGKALYNRENAEALINKIEAANVDTDINIELLLKKI